jgi:hypothetical protein
MTASSSAVSDFIRSARSICWTRLEIVRKNGAIRPVHCVSACKESCSRHAAARRVDGVALPRRKQFGNLFVLAVFMLVISSAGVGDAAPSVISTPWMRDWAKGEPLRKLLQSSTEPSVGYTWQVPPKYVASEAKLTVVGGCVLDLVTVRNHACALITETIPFYYRDEDGDLKVNQTLSEVKSRYVCWGAPFEDVFNDIDRHAFVQFAEGLGARGTIAACGINQLQEIQCFGSNDPSSDAFGNTVCAPKMRCTVCLQRLVSFLHRIRITLISYERCASFQVRLQPKDPALHGRYRGRQSRQKGSTARYLWEDCTGVRRRMTKRPCKIMPTATP